MDSEVQNVSRGVKITKEHFKLVPKKFQSSLQEVSLLSPISLQKVSAVLYYTSWWDFGGIEFVIGGIDPNCHRPKPRPTTPRDFFDLIYLLYQKGNFKTHPNVIPPMFFIKFSISCGMCGKVKVDH